MAAKKFEFPRMPKVEDLVKLMRESLGTVEKEFVGFKMSNISAGVEVTAGWPSGITGSLSFAPTRKAKNQQNYDKVAKELP